MTTWSPSAAARSTAVVLANRSRSASTCSSMSASVTSASSTVTVTSPTAGRVISGRTSTSAVNSSRSRSSIRVTSISGCPIGSRLLSATAWPYLAGTASLTTSERMAPRPSRASRIFAGTLPGRKPGMRTCPASAPYALSKCAPSSSNGTSTVSFTRVGFRCSTVLFTRNSSGSPDDPAGTWPAVARPARPATCPGRWPGTWVGPESRRSRAAPSPPTGRTGHAGHLKPCAP